MQTDAAARALAPAESDVASPQGGIGQTPAIRAALHALPGQERRIIELAYYGGWTQSEIADMLKLPLDTVRNSARLGLLRLRETLLRELEAPP